MTSFEIERLDFTKAAVNGWARPDQRNINWPVVYVLDSAAGGPAGARTRDLDDVYVGESRNATARMRQHFDSPEKQHLSSIRVIVDETFNKSVCLDLESFLIRMLAGDGSRRVLNRNDGITEGDYYARDSYQDKFRDVFEQLKDDGVFTRTIPEIENSDLFKLSPFKALSRDQAVAVEGILEGLFEDMQDQTDSTIVVQGDPGTGKTVVAIYLLKLIVDIANSPVDDDFDGDSMFSDFFADGSRELLAGVRIGLVVPQQSLRESIKKVFRKTPGLHPDMVMTAFDVGIDDGKFDLLVVDEAHRLNQRANQPSGVQNQKFQLITEKLFGWDDKTKTQLDWIRTKSRHQIFLLDAAQSVRPADVSPAVLHGLLVINNENQPASVYQNKSRQQNKNNYVGISLKGNEKNTFAVGSKIKIYIGNNVYYKEVIPARGFQASVDYKQIIGLGKNTMIDSMLIIWPDRTFTKLDKPQINVVHKIQQPLQNGEIYVEPISIKETLLTPEKNNFEKHTEDDFVDYYNERNLPELLSQEGPHIAKADVNGDGLEDIYIGGAKGQAGQLYLQTATGFAKKEEPVFKQFAEFEDVAVTFFDCDKDGDFDLFIGAGGNNAKPNERELQHRLYKNDGKGNFEIDTNAFPNNDMNIAVAAANDFDGDGDEDLFVGARSVPFNYGVSPQSYLYVNDGKGHFTDATNILSNNIATVGMVTGAVWANVAGDLKKELIIVGQWMTPRIFSYENKKFIEIKNTNLTDLYGWWQTVTTADLNADGKEDLILGNIGENFYLKPDSAHPVIMWLTDFDRSGTTQQFITRTIADKNMPVFLKKDVTEQFPFLKKNNLKNSDFATKSIEQLFEKEIIEKAVLKKFNYCSSVVAFNNGSGTFTIKKLPLQAQLSNINAICVTDINNDNKPDLIIGGNKYGFPPQFGRLDASFGDILINNGKNDFTALPTTVSGLKITGEIKDIKIIQGGNKKYLIAVRNNDFPVLYQLKK